MGVKLSSRESLRYSIRACNSNNNRNRQSHGTLRLAGQSKQIVQVKELVHRYAAYDYPVLIIGETGVGKTLVAQAIHLAGGRREKPFICQNCSNLSSDLFESELFGHEKGAFTGAIYSKIGKIEIANGGTLFLDEIGDLSLANQAKILRFLDSSKYFRIGGNEELTSYVRIISATNKDLTKEIVRNRFRQDLYFRLDVLSIMIPPLRERKEDIPILAKDIIRKENHDNRNSLSISRDAIQKLMEYDFPGNIRELENILKRAFVNSGRKKIEESHITICKSDSSANKAGILSEMHIEEIMKKHNGNKLRVAKELGISRTWLYKKLGEKIV